MTSESGPGTGATIYELRLTGHLGPDWADWFGGLAITQGTDGETVLVGPMVDQASLHAVLRRVRDLGLPLVSVRRLPDDTPDA